MSILDTKLVLIFIYGTSTIPIAIWLLMGFFRALPDELEESAILDGCNKFQVFTKVYLPLVRPGLVDRKSTRLNSSHVAISYAVFCLKKKKKYIEDNHV